jgi:2-aminobenzoate-CoA ligase
MSGKTPKLGPSGHVDDFARRNLPPPEQSTGPSFNIPIISMPRLN